MLSLFLLNLDMLNIYINNTIYGTIKRSNGKGQRNSMNSARYRNECVLEIGREVWLEMKLFT